MPTAPANAAGVELHYETFGEPDGEPLLFVMGLASQMILWDEELLQSFVDRGFFAIRYDNRDIGLSTKCDVIDPVEVGARILASFGGQPVEAPYVIADMAADAVSLLDHLGIDSAHVVGASMGGMIVQQLVIDHPERVRSITSIMSTTGDPDVGQPDPVATAALLQPPPTTRDEAIERTVETYRAIGSEAHFDEDVVRARATRAHDRSFSPEGTARQLLAIVASPSRTEGLGRVDVPSLVIHGDSDPLVTPSGGKRTAEAIPGAELLVLEGMGHDLPPIFWPQIVEAVTKVAARAAAPA